MTTPEEELYEIVKQGTNTTPGTSTGDDEGETTKGTTQVYEDPPGVETKPPDDANDSFSSGAVEASEDVQQGVLNRSFDSKKNSDQAEQALIRQNFTQAVPGRFIAHSVHLKGERVKKAEHPRSQSLLAAVRRLSGRT